MASDFSIKTPLPLPPLHAICFPFLTRTLCSSAAPLRFNMYLKVCLSRNLTHVLFLSFFHSCLEVSKKWKLAAPAF